MAEQAPRRAIPGPWAFVLIGAAAVLFFHPGAMDMDRIKWNLFLCLLPPVLAAGNGLKNLIRAFHSRMPAWLFAAALMTVFMIASCLTATGLSAEGLRIVVIFICLFTLAAALREARPAARFPVTAGLIAAGGLCAVYALLQVAGVDPLYASNPDREAVSTLGNTNQTAEVMALILPLALAFGFHGKRSRILAGTIALPFLTAALWLTGGRAGILAAVPAVLLTLLLCLRQGRTRPGPRLLLLAGMVGLGLILGGVLGPQRTLALKNIESEASILSPDYPTNKVRLEIWKGTLAMIRDHPFLGAGPGRFRAAFPPYRSAEEARIPGLMGMQTEVESPHNEYLWAAAVGGIPALLALTVCLALALRRACGEAAFAPEEDRSVLGAGASGLILAFMVLCLFSSPLHSPAPAILFFMAAGLGCGEAPGAAAPARGWGWLVTVPVLALLLCLSLFLGARGLLSDWASASVALGARVGQEEFETLKWAADLDPGNVDLNNYVGQIAAMEWLKNKKGEDDPLLAEALNRLNRVLASNPWHLGASKTLGRIYLARGDLDGARWAVARYQEAMGDRPAPDALLVEMLEASGRYREAAALYLDAPGLGAERLVERAGALLEEGRPEAAAVYADHYLREKPLDGDALYILGKSLKAAYQEGEKDAYRRMHIAFALDWIEKGDFEQAMRSVKSSLRYGEGAKEALLLQAILKAELGEPFQPPEDRAWEGNAAFVERLKTLSDKGKLSHRVR